MRTCTYSSCANKHSAKGFCKTHYLEFRRKELNAVWYEKNKDEKLEQSRKWLKENKEYWKKYNADFYLQNKKRCNLSSKKWRKENPAKTKVYSAKYRASLLKATPSWADLKKIEEIYLNCPKGYEVDHFYPLRGKDVCGLHVEYNLQYLSISENRRKSNNIMKR